MENYTWRADQAIEKNSIVTKVHLPLLGSLPVGERGEFDTSPLSLAGGEVLLERSLPLIAGDGGGHLRQGRVEAVVGEYEDRSARRSLH